jgi:hypothetical protein
MLTGLLCLLCCVVLCCGASTQIHKKVSSLVGHRCEAKRQRMVGLEIRKQALTSRSSRLDRGDIRPEAPSVRRRLDFGAPPSGSSPSSSAAESKSSSSSSSEKDKTSSGAGTVFAVSPSSKIYTLSSSKTLAFTNVGSFHKATKSTQNENPEQVSVVSARDFLLR